MNIMQKEWWMLSKNREFSGILSCPDPTSSFRVALKISSLTMRVTVKSSSLAVTGGDKMGLEFPQKPHF